MNLQEARLRKLLSVHELALKSGFSESNLYKLESGSWLPSLSTVQKLSEVLGVQPKEIDEFKAAIEKAEKSTKR